MTSTLTEGAGCVWVLSGSPDVEHPSALRWVPPPDKVVVADGGGALAPRLGLRPDLLVGDFDSLDPALRREWEEAGVQSRRYRHETKQETDTELAVLAALEWNPSTVIILGAIGGRLDHTLANVLLLTHPALSGRNVRIVEAGQELFLARHGVWTPIDGGPGDTVSLLPVGEDVTGVTLEGFEYPLRGETLLAGRGRGISNVLQQAGGRLWFDQGKLLVLVAHLKVPPT